MENTVITQALAEYKPLEANISNALPKVDEIVINGTWDENGYKSAKAALRQAKSVRKSIDEKRKQLKAVALEYSRAVDSEGNRLMALCDPTITEIEQRIAAIDVERERIKNEQRTRRAAELTEAGFTFSLGAYRIGAEIVHPSAIDDADESDWALILQRGHNEAERVKAEAERIAKERAELQRQQEELNREREKLARERAEAERAAAPVSEPKPTPVERVFFTPQNKPSAEYIAGYNACRSLCIAIVGKYGKRSEMVDAINNLEP